MEAMSPYFICASSIISCNGKYFGNRLFQRIKERENMKMIPRLDKTALVVTDLDDIEEEKNHWASKTGMERLAAVELNRLLVYGEDRIASRLQRFFEIAGLAQG